MWTKLYKVRVHLAQIPVIKAKKKEIHDRRQTDIRSHAIFDKNTSTSTHEAAQYAMKGLPLKWIQTDAILCISLIFIKIRTPAPAQRSTIQHFWIPSGTNL